jgi:hypothetical protein
MFSKIRTFFELPNSHKWIFIKISLIVPLVELGIKTIKFKRTLAILKLFINRNPHSPENELKLVGRYTNYLHLYHRKFPFLGKCLARSLTLWFLLKREGIETELKFGMKKENEKLLAHSWLEYDGKPLITKSEINEGYISFKESILIKVTK